MDYPQILDGSMGEQLTRYADSAADGDPLWASKFLVTAPEACVSAYSDFVIAGADFVHTNTYQVSIESLKTHLGLNDEQTFEVIKNSVQIARDGIKSAEKTTGRKYNCQVLGEVGPYGACQHDCSEYTGSYCDIITEDELIKWHRPRVTALIEGGVDAITFVTIPCLKEALALIKLLKEFPTVKGRINFSIKDSESNSKGENFVECVTKCWNASSQLLSIGANCFHPSLVTPLFKPLREKYPHIPTLASPSNGDIYDKATERWVASEDGLRAHEYVEEWLNLGIQIIGGCCPSTSDDIHRLAEKRDEWIKKRANKT